MELSPVDLSWLPSDADEQLALGFRIISSAYKTRVSSLEAEIRSLRAAANEKSDHLAAFQKKYSSLEVQLIECTQRGNQLADENRNLVATVKKLQREIDRLESLKRAVMNSIQEDRGEMDGDHRFYTTDDILHSAAPRTMLELTGADVRDSHFLKRNPAKASVNGTTNNTPKAFTNMHADKDTADGRNFVNIVKATLPTEEASELIGLIKKFNSQLITKEEALVQARQILGDNKPMIYEEFKNLFRI